MKPFLQAANDGNIEELEKLLSLGSNIDCIASDKSTALHYAVNANKIEAIHFLINNKASVDAKNNKGLTPLHMAANKGFDQPALALLEAGANPNSKDNAVRIIFSEYFYDIWHGFSHENGNEPKNDRLF